MLLAILYVIPFELNQTHCGGNGSVMIGDDGGRGGGGMVKVAESRWLSGSSGGVVSWGNSCRHKLG